MPDTVSPCAKFLLAAATGVLSGFGIGGGTLLVIALVFLFGVEQRAAQGANLWYFFPTAAASLAVHAKKNRIAWRVCLPARRARSRERFCGGFSGCFWPIRACASCLRGKNEHLF